MASSDRFAQEGLDRCSAKRRVPRYTQTAQSSCDNFTTTFVYLTSNKTEIEDTL
jgi:hypothetical protein